MNGPVGTRLCSHGRTVSLLGVLALVCASSRMTWAGELIFPLEEVFVFDLPKEAGQQFLIGQRSACGDKPDPNVTRYPKIVSERPLYGTVDFSEPLGEKDPGRIYCFVLDESAGTRGGYDRLYLDLNHDRDLTNDRPLASQKKPPRGAMLNYRNIKQQVCFENLAVPFVCGSETKRPLEIMPRLHVREGGYRTVSFVTTKAHRGRIELGGQRCDVLLGHTYAISGWFDQPWTALHVTPAGNRWPWDWWGGDRLNAMHKIGGTFYTFSATPAGDKLIVRPYEGPLGTFEVGAGGRQIDLCEISGSLRSEKTAVALGDVSNDNRPAYIRSCRLPVGDYLFEYVNLQYGTLRINISMNYHTDGRRQRLKGRQLVYGVAIREDKPFIFDFSNKPAVMFASPARDYRVKRGDELTVAAVLTDPVQDFMIRDLGIRGQEHGSLDPKVTIALANGEIVARGVMPFG